MPFCSAARPTLVRLIPRGDGQGCGSTDVADLLIVLSHWDQASCPPGGSASGGAQSCTADDLAGAGPGCGAGGRYCAPAETPPSSRTIFEPAALPAGCRARARWACAAPRRASAPRPPHVARPPARPAPPLGLVVAAENPVVPAAGAAAAGCSGSSSAEPPTGSEEVSPETGRAMLPPSVNTAKGSSGPNSDQCPSCDGGSEWPSPPAAAVAKDGLRPLTLPNGSSPSPSESARSNIGVHELLVFHHPLVPAQSLELIKP